MGVAGLQAPDQLEEAIGDSVQEKGYPPNQHRVSPLGLVLAVQPEDIRWLRSFLYLEVSALEQQMLVVAEQRAPDLLDYVIDDGLLVPAVLVQEYLLLSFNGELHECAFSGIGTPEILILNKALPEINKLLIGVEHSFLHHFIRANFGLGYRIGGMQLFFLF